MSTTEPGTWKQGTDWSCQRKEERRDIVKEGAGSSQRIRMGVGNDVGRDHGSWGEWAGQRRAKVKIWHNCNRINKNKKE